MLADLHALARAHASLTAANVYAAKLATMKQGARTDLARIQAMSQPEAAELLGVSRFSVQRAVLVREHGIPELAAAVEAGTMAVSLADLVAPPRERHMPSGRPS